MSCTFVRKFHFNSKLKQVGIPLLKMKAFILLTFFLLAANVFVAAEEEEEDGKTLFYFLTLFNQIAYGKFTCEIKLTIFAYN